MDIKDLYGRADNLLDLQDDLKEAVSQVTLSMKKVDVLRKFKDNQVRVWFIEEASAVDMQQSKVLTRKYRIS